MSSFETVTQGRSRRSNAGNRMRELLEKARAEDQEKDELFAEDAEDADFEEPTAQRDVFLEEFADTDDEAEDEDAEEREVLREERKAKKGKATFNPFVKIRGPTDASVPAPSAEEIALLDPSIDVNKMAPSTLVLEIRRQRREAKRAQRSETRRSNLRASTLKTESELIEKERQEKLALAASKKGRKAQHETGEVRGARPMSQAELIAAALEEEERNKEALTNWLKREEEKRELRRVGRKRVRGPRWTFVSRTVGKLVEVVGEGEDAARATTTPGTSVPAETPAPEQAQLAETPAEEAAKPLEANASESAKPPEGGQEQGKDAAPASQASALAEGEAPVQTTSSQEGPKTEGQAAGAAAGPSTAAGVSTTHAVPTDKLAEQSEATQPPEALETPSQPAAEAGVARTSEPAGPAKDTAAPPARAHPGDAELSAPAGPSTAPTVAAESSAAPGAAQSNKPPTSASETNAVAGPSTAARPSETPGPLPPPAAEADAPAGQYERNYLILSQVPGGLPAELRLILGDHVDWSDVKVIPARNRPINRRKQIDPLTGTTARYRDPATGVPFSSAESAKTLSALRANRYVWSEGGWWAGGEADAFADGVEDIPGWREACARGWLAGRRIPSEPEPEAEAEVEGEEEEGEEEAEEAEEEAEEPAPKRAKKSGGRAAAKRKPAKAPARAPAKKKKTAKRRR